MAIIGCGVSGANIARRLSAYGVKTAILEKAADVSFGVSKANSGIVHAGFHHNKKYLKTSLELQGNLMFDQLWRELDFPFRRCGIVVAALHEEEMKAVGHLYMQGVENGAVGIELCSRERLLELEPKISGDAVGGLYAPGGGIIEPYRFVFALVESALKNGTELHTNFEVAEARRTSAGGAKTGGAGTGSAKAGGTGERRSEERWTIRSADGRSVSARYAVNAAGLFADKVSAIFGAEEFSIAPRKGEYFLMDRLTQARPGRVIFPVPTQVSKGMLVIPTVEGTVLVGPTANEADDKGDFSTTGERLEGIFESGKTMVPSLSRNDVITNFAGLRPSLKWKTKAQSAAPDPAPPPPCLDGDFYIATSGKAPDFVQVAGIQSPGLTASPAIGEYVKNILRDMGLELREKPGWDPRLEDHPRLRGLDPFALDALIARDPAWGNIVCRCENVSEAEIALAARLGHHTLDGVKFFTRAQMGRCQGGFCAYKIIKIIMRETGLSWAQISKHGGASRILEGELQ